MITRGEHVEIRNLLENGLSKSEAARQLGVSRATIRKYAATPDYQPYDRKDLPKSKLEPFRDFIRARLDKYPLSAVRIFDEITRMGYGGSGRGMMSAEPFRSNKGKFNVWIVGNVANISANGEGEPSRGESRARFASCPMGDHNVLLSRKDFRSYAYVFSNDAYLSLGNSDNRNVKGALFLHEFGHIFGKLADEYVEPANGDKSRKRLSAQI